MMQDLKRLLAIAVSLSLALLLVGCHADTNYTQTFISESDSNYSLKLTSKAGLIRPAAEFPHNFMFKLFGTEELSGTYERNDGAGASKGTFVAGKEGDKQWIRLTSEDKREWTVTVNPGGRLVGDGDIVWELKTTTADARAASSFKIGE
jgi:hypothetical protein